ncbi:ATP-dependent endonuclease [uncultured Sphingomonas sp.]|uniref:ATP-dependent nuclease n=1 Tax=uncultured Sphingomonas sp. TaxID=158754 RepID=UPI0025D14C77|nr:ATP-binding protein [uncultured Sphingomonas sp.]
MMAAIRQVRVRRFRGVRETTWAPLSGLNAIIGAGDTGKSTLLDAVELALAPRRNMTFSDADFWQLDVTEPIDIRVTIGDLPDGLLDIDRYGVMHRGWDAAENLLSDEPGAGLEVVVTIRLTVDQDLEPRWGLYSDRADADGTTREIPPAERKKLTPTRLGVYANHHLAWGNRSILNKLAEMPSGAGGALADAARKARAEFGTAALAQVQDALDIVHAVAEKAGISGALEATALLDAHGISFSGGTIALHDKEGVPLRNLGVGSSRLLIAGLQAAAGEASPFVLVDEVEHGLEPHRIIRLLHTLGSKDGSPTRQVFLTTHSAVVVRELSAGQLWRAADDGSGHVMMSRTDGGVESQKTLRACAEAFLAPQVIVCEGPTEIGLLRGLDVYRDETGEPTLAALGAAFADGAGDNMINRACAFADLGYRTALLRDCDKPFTAAQLGKLTTAGVTQFHWDEGLSTEQALCLSLPDDEIEKLVEMALEECGKDKVNSDLHVQSAALNADMFSTLIGFGIDERMHLGAAAKKGGWFKNVTLGERVGREVLAPALDRCTGTMPVIIGDLRVWAAA